MKGKPPTARQLAFAVAWGLPIPTGADRERISLLIERAMEERSKDPATEEQWILSEAWDVELYDKINRGSAASRLFDHWDDDNNADIPDEIIERLNLSPPAPAKRGGCSLLFLGVGIVAMVWIVSRIL